MPIPVTCPTCGATARVPDTLLGRTVRCPQCFTPFPAPTTAPPPPPPPPATPAEPPTVTAAAEVGPTVVPVVTVRRPAPPRPAARPRPRPESNAGLWAGVAVGVAVFLALGGAGAAFLMLTTGHRRMPTFARGPQQPPAFPQPWPPGQIGPGNFPLAGPEPLAVSRPRPKPLADVRLPDARQTGAALAGPRRALADGFAVTPVQLDDAADVAGLCWAGPGDAFFALSRRGALRRVGFPGLDEQRRLNLGHAAGQVALSGEGLLVVLPQLEEVWVLDPDTLTVRRRVGVGGVRGVATGSELAAAYAFLTEADGPARVPVRIDLTTGGVTGVALVEGEHAGEVPGHEFIAPVLAADGRSLFAAAAPGVPARYRADGDRLTFEEAGDRGAGGPIAVSPDGRRVATAGRVFPAGDLRHAAFDLPAATAAGFDAAGRVYAASADHLLAVRGPDGGGRRAAAWPDRPAAARQLLVHPRGLGVLLLTDAGLLRVEVPAP